MGMIGLRGLAGWIVIVLLLAACSQGSERTPQLRPTRQPALKADSPPCRYDDSVPFHNIRNTCVEVIYHNVVLPEAIPALTGLALDSDGTLYMARTATGEIWAIHDVDHDFFPGASAEAPVMVAEGFDLPVALVVDDQENALYVLAMEGVIRLALDGRQVPQQTSILTGWPVEGDVWPGSIGIGPDRRLYVSLGAGCFACDPAEPSEGVLFSVALDGSDERLEAVGLRQPLDFAWHPVTGALWIGDSGRVPTGGSEIVPPDELNVVADGADFGFPYCFGDRTADPQFEPAQTGDCTDTQPPRVMFPHQSTPAGMAFYASDAFPFWEGDLIAVLRGSWNLSEPAGYALVSVKFDTDAQPTGAVVRIAPDNDIRSIFSQQSLAQYSVAGQGFFPYHPYDVVVSEAGWLYVSVEEGRVLRFRPRPDPASGG